MAATCSDCGEHVYTDSFGNTWWTRDSGEGFGSDGHAHDAAGPEDYDAPFTLGELEFYYTVVEGCREGAQCAWLTDLGEVARGTLRGFPYPIGHNDDIRLVTVRITTRTGFEREVTMADLYRRKLREFRIRL
ncbi:hypothetical protein SEA_OBLADI_147 [Gordonia phage ObLaDi]|uniref:Uncharacterized protein n=3 Tax=Cafassovirus TaxID=3425056 RepID=A0A9E7QCI1_9CAUD|nr:hypothetical protein SEA_CAFASSO_148 [Gordonia phage Cafasso]UVK59886.1 hypothetical protein SEA_ALEEMILY_146 [Gordonia phage Aleemily]UXE03870.1 hypothetical protein SEA_OBLADI_147 [Gordonia phage ObLaDi]